MPRWKQIALLAVLVAMVVRVLVMCQVINLGPSQAKLGKFVRVREGMARAEVYAMLGTPDDPAGPLGEQWDCDPTSLFLSFDPSGRVMNKLTGHDPRSRVERLLDRAERQWRKWFP